MVSTDRKLSPFGNDRGGASKTRKKRAGSRKSRPLDDTTLRDLALAYAARFSTTGAKLEGYLARKIRERGVAEDQDGRAVDLDVRALVERLIELGYVDDAAYARARSRDLTGRGYGKRRVEQALWAAGVDDDVRHDHAPSEAEGRRAAILLAKKRRFGIFGTKLSEDLASDARRAAKEKQIAAMLRAGHDFADVRFILDASQEHEIDAWLIEAEEAERDEEDNGTW